MANTPTFSKQFEKAVKERRVQIPVTGGPVVGTRTVVSTGEFPFIIDGGTLGYMGGNLSTSAGATNIWGWVKGDINSSTINAGAYDATVGSQNIGMYGSSRGSASLAGDVPESYWNTLINPTTGDSSGFLKLIGSDDGDAILQLSTTAYGAGDAIITLAAASVSGDALVKIPGLPEYADEAAADAAGLAQDALYRTSAGAVMVKLT